MALLMCSPIRPVPPIMRMFWEVDMVGGGGVGCGWVGKWFWSEEWSSSHTTLVLSNHVMFCSLIHGQ